MSCHVLIVGVPSPADCAADKTWRAAAELVFNRLVARFGDAVTVQYAELFGPEMSRHPHVESWIASGEANPPIVAIDGDRRFAGGKLMVSAIERAVAEIVARGPVPIAAGRVAPMSDPTVAHRPPGEADRLASSTPTASNGIHATARGTPP